jgi:hypothetical protein
MIGSDPVKFGLVASLNRPGGNITGVSVLFNLMVQKQFEILKEAVPKADLIGLLVNPANPNAESDAKEAQAAAEALDRKVAIVGTVQRAAWSRRSLPSAAGEWERCLSLPIHSFGAGSINSCRSRHVTGFPYFARIASVPSLEAC